jgi:hypothetical protein
MEKLAVEFEDVSIVQAVSALAEDSVQLTVLLDAGNRFQARTCLPQSYMPCRFANSLCSPDIYHLKPRL